MKKYISQEKLARLKEKFPAVEYDEAAKEPIAYAAPDDIIAVLTFLRDAEDFKFDRLVNETAIDWKTYIEVVYNLFSWESYEMIALKVKLDRAKPRVASATAVFPGVEFEEREIFDLMGVEFSGHPDLRRILLADDFEGHPLRKDYVQIMPPRVRRVARGE